MLHDAVEIVDERTDLLEVEQPCRRELERVAVEQRETELGFKIGNVPAERRGGQVQLLSCDGVVEPHGQFDELARIFEHGQPFP